MAAGMTPPQGMPPGGSPTAMPTQNQGQVVDSPMPTPEQALQMFQQMGVEVNRTTLMTIKAAIESLEQAGMLSEEPEPEMEAQGSDANARLAQMLAG